MPASPVPAPWQKVPVMTSPTPESPVDAAAEPQTEAAPAEAAEPGKAAKKPKIKPAPPSPREIVQRIGDTSEAALAYVLQPDPQLSRLGRKVKEDLITEVPPVTAAALLGVEALARHFLASAAGGRYRDLFFMWDLFRERPDECRQVLAERPAAVEKGRHALQTAYRLGIKGHAERVAEDVTRATGLVWSWLREELHNDLGAVARRPAVAAALLRREPETALPLPETPDDQWLAEAVAARAKGELPAAMDKLVADNLDRLPAGIPTLSLVHTTYPERVGALLERVALDALDFGAVLAWARDHGHDGPLRARIQAEVREATARDRAKGLARWRHWRDRGIELPLPDALTTGSLDGLDLGKPETAELVAHLMSRGAAIQPQTLIDEAAANNRQVAEKAYEAFVCAGLDVTLPPGLLDNPIVKAETRCPACRAWTWVRPGHELRCPRLAARQAAAPPEQTPAETEQAPAEPPTA